MSNQFLAKSSRYLVITAFIVVFFTTLITNIPAWILSSQLTKYSEGRLNLYNLAGSFWSGSGLLVASSKKGQSEAAPLVYLHWKISVGFTKYVDVKFSMDKHPIAEVYLNKSGLNINKLDLSLSVIQVSQLSDVVKDLNISGNFHIQADQILLNKKNTGVITATIKNVSSGMSPVNPLGDYNLAYDLATNKINVKTAPGAVLNLSGEGSANSLTLDATIEPSKVEQMRTFITLLGVPKANGVYSIKLF